MAALQLVEACGISGVMFEAGAILTPGADITLEDAHDLFLLERAIEVEAIPQKKGKSAE